MTERATTVEEYLDRQDESWRPVLERLRALCLERLVGCTEEIAYGMPSYTRGGRGEIAFAKQARYLSLYVPKLAVLDAHRAELAGLSVGKGCVRFTRADQIDWSLVEVLVSETAASDDEPC